MSLLLGASLLLIGYAYVVYPMIVGLLAYAAPRPHRREDIEPLVSLVILACGSEGDLARKLENALALDYPSDRLELVVAGDATVDPDGAITARFAARGVTLLRTDAEQAGRTETINQIAPRTRGEVLVFTDLTGLLTPGTLRALVRNFADASVGAVTGHLNYHYPDTIHAQGFRTYQRGVVFVRRSESSWGTETSVTSRICAVRRSAFASLPAHLDFELGHPLHAALLGLRTVYEDGAISEEVARDSARAEYDARFHMAMLGYMFLPYLLKHAAEIRSGAYAFQVLSHKAARLLTPLALIGLVLSSALLARESELARVLLVLQAAFYGSAWVAWKFPLPGTVGRILGLPFFLVTLHLAFLDALVRVLSGQRTEHRRTVA